MRLNISVISLIIVVVLMVGCSSTSKGEIENSNQQQSDSKYFTEAQIRSIDVHRLDSGYPVGLLADGGLVVMETPREGMPNSLWVWSKDNSKSRLLAKASDGKVIYDAVVGAKYVAFAEADPGMVLDKWRIVSINIDTNEVLVVDESRLTHDELQPITMTLMGPNLAVSGDRLIWSAFEPNPSGGTHHVVRSYDLDTLETRIIVSQQPGNDGMTLGGAPQLDGEVLVYNPGHLDFQRNTRVGRILAKNLVTEEEWEIASGDHVHSPVTHSGYVAWVTNNNTINIINLETGVQSTVASGGGSRWEPTIDEGVVGWISTDTSADLYLLPVGPTVTMRAQDTRGVHVKGGLAYWYVVEDGDVFVEWIPLR